MNHTLKHLAAITVFTTLFLLVLFCPNVNAQTSKSKLPNKEDLEVQKFVDSFIQSLEETKDINQVPEKFFVRDFKTRLAKNESWFSDSSEFFKQLSESERYDANVSFINFSYLGLMCSGGNDVDFTEGVDETSEDKVDTEKIFPLQILALVKKSKTVNALFDDSNSIVKNVAEFLEMTADMKKIADAERKYLIENKSKWEAIYAKNVKKARNEFRRSGSEVCEGKDCDNLPEKTRMFYNLTFPFMLSIIKENNDLRILSIDFPNQ